MNLHEYQSKKILAKYGVPVPEGLVAANPDEAEAAARALGGASWVVKAQVHAGGRGKAGGVKLARDLEAVRAAAAAMLGQRLVTRQTGPAGLPVDKVYVEAGSEIERELYLSLTLNRECGRIAIVASAAGGMDIEEVAHATPERILAVAVHPATGLLSWQCRQLALGLGLDGEQAAQFHAIATALYRLYLEKDASLIEINPLIVTRGGALVALDCKLDIDANALFRQPEMAALRDRNQEDPSERAASEHELNYVALDGDIACMVNGAGLAMATMDLIKLQGGVAGQLPRRGRRRHGRARGRRLRADPVESEGARHPRQHLRRHRALRPHRRRHHQRGARRRRARAGRGAARGHQCRGGARQARGRFARDHAGDRPDRRGAQGGRGREGARSRRALRRRRSAGVRR